MSEYIIVSTAVTDDIFLANLDYVGSYLGGAGIYALAGISLWTKNATILTGVGTDFFKRYFSWFESNGLSTEGIYEAAPLTPRTNVQYLPGGERIETPCFGASHYAKMEPSATDIAQKCKNARGVYIFKEANSAFWDTLLKAKEQEGFAIEWEINADSAKGVNYQTVKNIAEHCEIFSINLQESLSLLSVQTIEEVINIFYKWNVPLIFLRTGRNGSIVIRENNSTFVPSIPGVNATDPTGAGNASSAAVLYGFCEGYSDYNCGILGNISAATVITQFGPPKDIQKSREYAQETFINYSI